jgi:hypothetical protein
LAIRGEKGCSSRAASRPSHRAGSASPIGATRQRTMRPPAIRPPLAGATPSSSRRRLWLPRPGRPPRDLPCAEHSKARSASGPAAPGRSSRPRQGGPARSPTSAWPSTATCSLGFPSTCSTLPATAKRPFGVTRTGPSRFTDPPSRRRVAGSRPRGLQAAAARSPPGAPAASEIGSSRGRQRAPSPAVRPCVRRHLTSRSGLGGFPPQRRRCPGVDPAPVRRCAPSRAGGRGLGTVPAAFWGRFHFPRRSARNNRSPATSSSRAAGRGPRGQADGRTVKAGSGPRDQAELRLEAPGLTAAPSRRASSRCAAGGSEATAGGSDWGVWRKPAAAQRRRPDRGRPERRALSQTRQSSSIIHEYVLPSG